VSEGIRKGIQDSVSEEKRKDIGSQAGICPGNK